MASDPRASTLPATQRLRAMNPRTHKPIFDFAGEPRAQITPRTQSQSLWPIDLRLRAFNFPGDPKPSTLSETHVPISLTVRFWFLCDFDFCCCCGGVGGGVLVVFLLYDGGFCLLAVDCGFWLSKFAVVGWIGVSVVCDVVSVVGINFGGCGLLLVVASDGYLVVICYVNWDLAVILKFSVIKFVWMLRK